MKYELVLTGRFKRGLKLAKKCGLDISLLADIVEKLLHKIQTTKDIFSGITLSNERLDMIDQEIIKKFTNNPPGNIANQTCICYNGNRQKDTSSPRLQKPLGMALPGGF